MCRVVLTLTFLGTPTLDTRSFTEKLLRMVLSGTFERRCSPTVIAPYLVIANKRKNYIVWLNPVGEIAKKAAWRSAFLLI